MAAKKTKQLILLAILIIVGLNPLSSQTVINQVDHYNLQQFMTDLQSTYGPSLGTSYQNIQNHLNRALQNYDPRANCATPSGVIIEFDNQTIKFKWAPISGAQNYRINFINTDSGQEGFFNIQPSIDSTYTITVSGSGKFIFSIQSVCQPPVTSALNIIIHDVVMSTVTFEDDIPCECDEYESTQELGNSWPPLQPGMSFDLRVVNPGSPVNLSTIHAEVLEEEIQFNISCPGQFLPELENNMLYFYENNTYKGYFSFEPSYYFLEGQIVLFSICKDEDGNRKKFGDQDSSNPNENQPVIFPNPVKSFLMIRNANTIHGEVAMKIFDASGKEQEIEQMEMNNLSGEYLVHVKGLNPGWYFLSIINEGSVQTLPFFKQ